MCLVLLSGRRNRAGKPRQHGRDQFPPRSSRVDAAFAPGREAVRVTGLDAATAPRPMRVDRAVDRVAKAPDQGCATSVRVEPQMRCVLRVMDDVAMVQVTARQQPIAGLDLDVPRVVLGAVLVAVAAARAAGLAVESGITGGSRRHWDPRLRNFSGRVAWGTIVRCRAALPSPCAVAQDRAGHRVSLARGEWEAWRAASPGVETSAPSTRAPAPRVDLFLHRLASASRLGTQGIRNGASHLDPRGHVGGGG